MATHILVVPILRHQNGEHREVYLPDTLLALHAELRQSIERYLEKFRLLTEYSES